MQQESVILVFSHLRWDFVYQRPQHLLSRLARSRRVIFFEEPFGGASDSRLEISHPEPGVTVARPHTRAASRGFCDEQCPELRGLLAELMARERISDYVLWFYTPMALPLAEGLQPRAVVYDCMDELSAFLGAPPDLLEREKQLLQFADVVFTGGPSLYRAKKDRHPNVHCFPSSVDAAHYAKAAGPEAFEADDQKRLPRPRLGYFGVIDERMDLDIVSALADAHPEWQVCMVGPVIKIDPAALPQRPNLHYFGQRQYRELPSYVAGWDLCLLPFARNESTRFISPTKTPEYMAAEKMIVSTPITDVVEPYGHIVWSGATAEAFVDACEKAMACGAAERARKLAAMKEVLARTSWEATASSMLRQVEAAEKGRSADGPLDGRTLLDAMESQLRGIHAEAPERRTVIVGAGPTGLSAAYHLEDSLLIEQNDQVGGWCRSLFDNGFTFDFAGHIMFSNEPYVHEMYKMLLGDNVHWQDREAWIYSKNVYTRYPFQGSLYGLPPAVIKECIMGAIEARFGPAKKNAAGGANGKANGHRANGTNGTNGKTVCAGDAKGDSIADCCADGILESSAKLGVQTLGQGASTEPRNFEEFIYKVWGAGIAKHFAVPYNRKLWAVPLTEMETSWLGGRVPMPDLEEMIEGALSPSPKPMGPNARFGYPLRGGFQALMNGFLPHLDGRLRLNTRVAAVSPRRRTITLSNGEEIAYEHLVSTMPLPVLIRSMGDEAPPSIRKAAASLRHVSVRCVNLGVGREKLTEKHWIYYPEDTVFHRIFVQGNASPHCNPPGGFGLTCEITYSEHKPLPCDGEALIRRCIADCHKVGIFTPRDSVIAANQVDMPYAYVVYDHGRAAAVAAIREWLAQQDILLAGRYSEWEYYNSDHAFVAGRNAADQVLELRRQREMAEVLPGVWARQRETVQGD